jgi:predicted dehydrogenase
MTLRVIQVGTGGWGRSWVERFLPPNVADGLIEVVAAVDKSEEALANAQRALGLRPDQCFTDIGRAFDQVHADFCTVVVPPAYHESVVDLALAHNLNILSEKPIADTLDGSVRIAEKVRRAGVKMAVTMSHRFDQDKTTLRQQLRSGSAGPLDYLMMRFTCDARRFGTWGHFRHEIADTLMIEGAVHHLDILADLAGAACETLYAETWNPAWGEYGGDSQGLVTMRFANGVRAVYEGAKTNAVGLNGWAQEYVRVEGRDATLIMDRREIERFAYDPSERWRTAKAGEGEQIPLLEQPKWANAWLIETFVRWLNGGDQMVTNVDDNLQSVALVFAAIESSRTGSPVKVQELLAQAQARVRAEMGG